MTQDTAKGRGDWRAEFQAELRAISRKTDDMAAQLASIMSDDTARAAEEAAAAVGDADLASAESRQLEKGEIVQLFAGYANIHNFALGELPGAKKRAWLIKAADCVVRGEYEPKSVDDAFALMRKHGNQRTISLAISDAADFVLFGNAHADQSAEEARL